MDFKHIIKIFLPVFFVFVFFKLTTAQVIDSITQETISQNILSEDEHAEYLLIQEEAMYYLGNDEIELAVHEVGKLSTVKLRSRLYEELLNVSITKKGPILSLLKEKVVEPQFNDLISDDFYNKLFYTDAQKIQYIKATENDKYFVNYVRLFLNTFENEQFEVELYAILERAFTLGNPILALVGIDKFIYVSDSSIVKTAQLNLINLVIDQMRSENINKITEQLLILSLFQSAAPSYIGMNEYFQEMYAEIEDQRLKLSFFGVFCQKNEVSLFPPSEAELLETTLQQTADQENFENESTLMDLVFIFGCQNKVALMENYYNKLSAQTRARIPPFPVN